VNARRTEVESSTNKRDRHHGPEHLGKSVNAALLPVPSIECHTISSGFLLLSDFSASSPANLRVVVVNDRLVNARRATNCLASKDAMFAVNAFGAWLVV
jgi:hypothetical protein